MYWLKVCWFYFGCRCDCFGMVGEDCLWFADLDRFMGCSCVWFVNWLLGGCTCLDFWLFLLVGFDFAEIGVCTFRWSCV